MSRVVVVGSVNMDIGLRVDRLPEPGETILGGDVTYQPGGKGGNQAVAARRLGADVSLQAAVGCDVFGRELRAHLEVEEIELGLLSDLADKPTGVALIEVSEGGENTIVVSPGANSSPVRTDALREAVNPGDVVLIQLEIPTQVALHAAMLAEGTGAVVILNAAPTPASGASLTQLLQATDVLVVNQTEALSLSAQSTPTETEQWIGVAKVLCDQGPRATVITLGARGAVAFEPAGGWAQAAYPATVVDTTGSGDAFCGALAAALGSGMDLRVAVRRGCAAGALAAGAPGAQTALPTRTELENLMEATG